MPRRIVNIPQTMQAAISLFALRLIFGMNLMLCIMPREKVPSAFFRIILLVELGLAVLFALTSPAMLWWGVALSAATFVGSVLWLLERRGAGLVAISMISGLSLFAMNVLPTTSPEEVTIGPWLPRFSSLASAGTLGAALTGMLLGHRYLTAQGMPLTPLIWLNAGLGIAAIFRCLVSLAALATGIALLTDSTYWIWLALRWLAGILGPMAACIMVHRILRYRNTQAATGVLFVAVILTFIGELTADLLQRALEVPF
jgi:hypothetical protein